MGPISCANLIKLLTCAQAPSNLCLWNSCCRLLSSSSLHRSTGTMPTSSPRAPIQWWRFICYPFGFSSTCSCCQSSERSSNNNAKQQLGGFVLKRLYIIGSMYGRLRTLIDWINQEESELPPPRQVCLSERTIANIFKYYILKNGKRKEEWYKWRETHFFFFPQRRGSGQDPHRALIIIIICFYCLLPTNTTGVVVVGVGVCLPFFFFFTQNAVCAFRRGACNRNWKKKNKGQAEGWSSVQVMHNFSKTKQKKWFVVVVVVVVVCTKKL